MEVKVVMPPFMKDKKNIAIIVLSVLLIISSGICIYLKQTGSHELVNNLLNTIGQLEEAHAAQGESLHQALEDIRAGDEWAAKVQVNTDAAVDIAHANREDIGLVLRDISTGTIATSNLRDIVTAMYNFAARQLQVNEDIIKTLQGE